MRGFAVSLPVANLTDELRLKLSQLHFLHLRNGEDKTTWSTELLWGLYERFMQNTQPCLWHPETYVKRLLLFGVKNENILQTEAVQKYLKNTLKLPSIPSYWAG